MMDHATGRMTGGDAGIAPGVKILGIGGSARPASTAERVLSFALAEAEKAGAQVSLLAGPDLVLAPYDPGAEENAPSAARLLRRISEADGILLASPVYHGGIPGLLKNALDHVEELRSDARPYFSGRAVGCVAVGGGWQGAVATLSALRDVVHALRGWPTPLGVALNSSTVTVGGDGRCGDQHVEEQIRTMTHQVLHFALAYGGRNAPIAVPSPAARLVPVPATGGGR
ncbi:NADPH-dependent FMN reductase (plasmid) [Streptomyces sp. HUAS TT11]|uniref:NADPH-dependent FMN reductase n=1 Tax=Streptomyces sp. HUAS TT11 TaxID=3447508 RepID=UPI003F65595B